MSPGVRRLTVLGKFKPFGLIAEATDGKPPDVDVSDSYEYFLFDPGQLDDDADGNEAKFSRQREHELFIRDNHIIWTSGSRVLKRFTLSSPIIKACWSHLGRGPEAFLCVLQIGCLTVYSTSGGVVSVPLSRTVISIWPLQFGLLLQQAAEVNQSSHIPLSSATPTLGSREMLRLRKEIGNISPQNFNSPGAHDLTSKRDMSTHLILRDPLEEPEPIYLEERGKLNIMKDYDERTIWTSDRLPLMTSYNKGKMQHSVWAAEFIESNLESSGVVPDTVFPKRVSFRRIWQAKDRESAEKDSGFRDLKITGLSDAVLGCINLSVNHSQIFRCALTGSPSSSLANDCIAALAEGLRPDLYNFFFSLLWEDDYSDQKGSCIHFEWEALCNNFLQPKTSSESSWEFHKTYPRFHSGITSNNYLELDKTGGGKIPSKSLELMVQSLDCLHAVYESLKMDNLRKQDLHQLAVLLCNIATFIVDSSSTSDVCYIH